MRCRSCVTEPMRGVRRPHPPRRRRRASPTTRLRRPGSISGSTAPWVVARARSGARWPTGRRASAIAPSFLIAHWNPALLREATAVDARLTLEAFTMNAACSTVERIVAESGSRIRCRCRRRSQPSAGCTRTRRRPDRTSACHGPGSSRRDVAEYSTELQSPGHFSPQVPQLLGSESSALEADGAARTPASTEEAVLARGASLTRTRRSCRRRRSSAVSQPSPSGRRRSPLQSAGPAADTSAGCTGRRRTLGRRSTQAGRADRCWEDRRSRTRRSCRLPGSGRGRPSVGQNVPPAGQPHTPSEQRSSQTLPQAPQLLMSSAADPRSDVSQPSSAIPLQSACDPASQTRRQAPAMQRIPP